ncbi:MAG: AbrB family transcriptional regulator [Hyphomicrobiaceae bacterium]|nr:AbrB family transcriptional regulator [Hyphomicrobiaceae bacterium]
MSRPSGLLSNRPSLQQWAALLGLSLVMTVAAEAVHLPAALMIGPMVAAIVIACAEGTIRMARWPFIAAQGIIGCLIGRSIPLTILDELAKDWPLFLAGVVSVIAIASTMGYLLARAGFLPGTTAIWGTSPGASTAMIIMSEAHGGDVRLVAVMQQLRIVLVIGIAALVAKAWAPSGTALALRVDWFPTIAWGPFVTTLVLAGAGAALATALRIPAGALLLPLAASMVFSGTGLMTIELPPWLLALAYGLVGWSIGLRFTWPILSYAFGLLPRLLAIVLALIAACGLMAGGLVVFAGIDPLTAYLATSPGGADSIAVIAASSNVDMRFVMAMQTARLVVVLVVSPIISRLIAERTVTSAESRPGSR